MEGLLKFDIEAFICIAFVDNDGKIRSGIHFVIILLVVVELHIIIFVARLCALPLDVLVLVIAFTNMIGDAGVKGIIFLSWTLAISGMKCQIVTCVHLIIEAGIDESDDFGIVTLFKTIVFPVSQINPIIQLAGVIAIPQEAFAQIVRANIGS